MAYMPTSAAAIASVAAAARAMATMAPAGYPAGLPVGGKRKLGEVDGRQVLMPATQHANYTKPKEPPPVRQVWNPVIML